MKDPIERQAAIDAIKTSRYLVDAMEKVIKLPSAQPEPKWIPCSVSPPVFPCVVCDAHGNRPSVPSALVTLKSEEHGTWVVDGKWYEMYKNTKKYNCMLWENRIVAWMPLPEPYKEENR